MFAKKEPVHDPFDINEIAPALCMWGHLGELVVGKTAWAVLKRDRHQVEIPDLRLPSSLEDHIRWSLTHVSELTSTQSRRLSWRYRMNPWEEHLKSVSDNGELFRTVYRARYDKERVRFC